MTQIGQLLAEHCPQGVEFRPVGAASVSVRMPGKVKRQDYGLGSEFPIVDQSLDYIAGYTDERALVVPAAQYVVFGDHTRAVKFVDFAFAQGADGVKVLQAADGLSTRWLYYCLASLNVPNRGYNRHWTVLRDLRIPIPPPMVQQEIIRVLDEMEDLRVALEDELQARQWQNEHYRDLLFGFPEDGSTRWTTMGKAGQFIRGRRFTKDDVVSEGLASIHYGEIYTHYGAWATATVSRVRSGLASRLRFAQRGDVVIAAVGETVDDICKAVAWLGEEDVAVHDDCFIFRHSMNPKFVSYYFQTSAFRAEKRRHVARAKVKRISDHGLAKLRIPVPPPDEQERIVTILDKFDALVNDLTVGLPAELHARRKQYEYYRDRLLTFAEAA